MEDRGRPPQRQHIHSQQHPSRERVSLPDLRQERRGPLRSVSVTDVGRQQQQRWDVPLFRDVSSFNRSNILHFNEQSISEFKFSVFFLPLKVHVSSKGVTSTDISFERPPSILVPLKVHAPPEGYQLYMTCAVRGSPTPSVSWFLNDVCINSDNNYYITNSFGVCSMFILRVRQMDSGEYKVVAVNSFGKAECSTKLVVRGKF